MRRCLITGSSGLIGSEAARYFHQAGYAIHGVDNNQRATFFGAAGDTRENQQRLVEDLPHFRHCELDVRDRAGALKLLAEVRPHVVIHTAAQPSHDHAARIPFDDFDINAGGTLNLLEAARQACPEAPFIHMSTNKVYGDAPNRIAMTELATRWDFADPAFRHGVPESLSIDQSLHSLFGASKVAADVMVQEYGRYFGMPTCCLRGGCLTGPGHAGVEQHGFLSYLTRCNLEGAEYRLFGYKGKQVRDNIHSHDVAAFMHAFSEAPRAGAVYNLGGGKGNSCSVREAFALVEEITGLPQQSTYVEESRRGDHLCYYSDLRRAHGDYPKWRITRDLPSIIAELIHAWQGKRNAGKLSALSERGLSKN